MRRPWAGLPAVQSTVKSWLPAGFWDSRLQQVFLPAASSGGHRFSKAGGQTENRQHVCLIITLKDRKGWLYTVCLPVTNYIYFQMQKGVGGTF